MRARHLLISSTVATQWLQRYAAENRATPTESEARLWSALSARKLGVPFRPQAVLGNRFIVDFLARRARLVVEVDGWQSCPAAGCGRPPEQQATQAGLPSAAAAGRAGHE
jgi:very-short-patch-repair endonuclease